MTENLLLLFIRTIHPIHIQDLTKKPESLIVDYSKMIEKAPRSAFEFPSARSGSNLDPALGDTISRALGDRLI